MKLIFCPYCQDIVKLHRRLTICGCGRSFGAYLDELKAVYAGDAIPLGINNKSMAGAIKTQPASGQGKYFEAFVIPKKCPTFTKVKKIGTTKPAPHSLGPIDVRCQLALRALIASKDSGFLGAIGKVGTILVRNGLARRLGPQRFGPSKRYVVFELTETGEQACRSLGLIRKTGVKRGPYQGIRSEK